MNLLSEDNAKQGLLVSTGLVPSPLAQLDIWCATKQDGGDSKLWRLFSGQLSSLDSIASTSSDRNVQGSEVPSMYNAALPVGRPLLVFLVTINSRHSRCISSLAILCVSRSRCHCVVEMSKAIVIPASQHL